MSFAHAPVSKGLMVGLAATSLFASIFDVKHYFHLQLVPHISRDHQYWRLMTHPLTFGNSSELLIAELLLYNVSVHIERAFGTSKFASFAAVSQALSTLLSFVLLLVFHQLGLNYIPAGPTALLSNIMYQYARVVPASYVFRIFGLNFSNKIFLYVVALQLVISAPPGSIAVSSIGILTGVLYRSDLVGLKSFRLSPQVQSFSSRVLLPLVGSTQLPRRQNFAFPDLADNAPSNRDIITTAPITARTSTNGLASGNPQTSQSQAGANTGTAQAGTSSVLNQWVDELTGRGQASGVRVPTSAEISQLSSMFPDASRDTIVTTLQRSPNAERAVEMMLSGQS